MRLLAKKNPFKDATVAYSLRDLNLGVTSNVVRVRRSSDNVEQDFTAIQVTDGTLTSFCGAGDGFVSIWYDQTGVYDASQTTALRQPKIVSAGALILDNGKPALDFDGADDMFIIPFDTQIKADNFANGVSSFCTFNHGTKTNQGVYDLGLLNTRGNIFYAESNGTSYTSRSSVPSSGYDTLVSSTSVYKTAGVDAFGLKNNLSINGVLTSGTGDYVSPILNDRLVIGQLFDVNYYFEGTIQEQIFFGTDKSTERPQIETNINNHYRIYSTPEQPFNDATVAYSLRDLNLGVTSNVVRVRRSSDNLEQDFTATQIIDGSLTSFCGAGDGFVSVWYDQTGVYDASQVTALEQPKIVTAGALIFDGGKPAFEFNTNGQRLNIDDNGGLNGIRQGDFTYASVANLNTRAGSWQAILSLAASPTNGQGSLAHQFYDSTPNEFGFHYTWVSANKIANVTLNNELNKMFAFLSRSGGTTGNGGLITNYVKDSLGTVFENSGNQDWNSNTGTLAHIGKQGRGTNTDTWIGTIQEVVIFPSDKTAERPDIETNINEYYAIY